MKKAPVRKDRGLRLSRGEDSPSVLVTSTAGFQSGVGADATFDAPTGANSPDSVAR